MKTINNIVKLIGDTPFVTIDLNIPNTTVYAKLETYNLTGSIKDRMALCMLQQAQKKKLLNKNSTIIEATTGNTGISFAALSAIFGYKMIAVMPEGQSEERIKMIKAYGAKMIITPKKDGPMGAILIRNKLHQEINNSWIPDQFSNFSNIMAHEKTTAQEILKQLEVIPGIFVHGIGTGGTLMGIGNVLKKYYPKIKSVAVEPAESAVLSGEKPGEHNIQGIGEGFIPKIVNVKIVDETVKVSTEEAVTETKCLAQTKGIFVGFSSGANISAIRKIARNHRRKINVITVFADRGERYLSEL